MRGRVLQCTCKKAEHCTSAGEGRYCAEPMFVPKQGAKGGYFDGNEGYILVNVTDVREPGRETTSLEILDAAKLEDGPLAVIDLKELLPPGLHGSWTETYFGQTEDEMIPWQNDIRQSL
jgi:all-trans-8'-apo-beta-carotenal 15,15'-oxygenase